MQSECEQKIPLYPNMGKRKKEKLLDITDWGLGEKTTSAYYSLATVPYIELLSCGSTGRN